VWDRHTPPHLEKNVMPPPVQSRSVACDGGTMAE